MLTGAADFRCTGYSITSFASGHLNESHGALSSYADVCRRMLTDAEHTSGVPASLASGHLNESHGALSKGGGAEVQCSPRVSVPPPSAKIVFRVYTLYIYYRMLGYIRCHRRMLTYDDVC
jgi:hypothetical protein